MKLALIGHPVAHSLSPVIHTAALRHCGIDGSFDAVDVADGEVEAVLESLWENGATGCSVTAPHKATAAGLVDVLDEHAARTGAVNCIRFEAGRTMGCNTDGIGFVRGFEHDTGTTVEGRRFGVLGAGGAARAIIDAVASHGAAEVVVVNRDADRAALAAQLAGGRGRVGTTADLGDVDVIVGATTVGGAANPSSLCPASVFNPGQVVVDVLYDPAETVMLAAARARGAATFNGLSMLVHQGAAAFELWTGRQAPVGEMFDAARRRVAR